MSFVLKSSKVPNLNSDHFKLKIPYKISIKREEKRQTIGRNKRTKLTSNTKNSTTKVSLSQGILKNSLSSSL